MPVLYRIAETDPPTERDFLVDRLRGHRDRMADETGEEWDSFSAFTDFAKVRKTAAYLKQHRNLPALYVVRLVISDDAPVAVFPYRGSRSHFGVRGDPALLCTFAAVTAIV